MRESILPDLSSTSELTDAAPDEFIVAGPIDEDNILKWVMRIYVDNGVGTLRENACMLPVLERVSDAVLTHGVMAA